MIWFRFSPLWIVCWDDGSWWNQKTVRHQTPYATNRKCHPRTVDRIGFPTGKCTATSFHGAHKKISQDWCKRRPHKRHHLSGHKWPIKKEIRLRGAYEEKLFKIIVREFDFRNTLENIFNSKIDTLFQRNVCEQALNVKGIGLAWRGFGSPVQMWMYHQQRVRTEYEVVGGCKGI